MSPELEHAIAAAIADERHRKPRPLHDRRGFLVVGPQFVTPSDVIAKLMEEARGRLAAEHYAPSPDAERKAHVVRTGRRRRYAAHGRAQFLAEVYG